MKYYYVASEKEGKKIKEKGIVADDRGAISIIALKDSFLMDKFVIDVYAYEVLGVEEFYYFEIAQDGISGHIIDSDIDNSFSVFFKLLLQPFIHSSKIKFITTDRYDGMGLDVGVHLVENKDKFDDEYKQKILGYDQGIG